VKVVIIFFTIVLIVGSVGAAIYYNQNSFRSEEILNKERYTRMLTEENLEKANIKVSSLQGDMKDAKVKITSLEKLLQQKKLLAENLQSRLEKTLASEIALKEEIERLEHGLMENKIPSPAIGR